MSAHRVLFREVSKVLISVDHKAQSPMATATGYVRRENAVLDFCCHDSLFDEKPPSGGGYEILKDIVMNVFPLSNEPLTFSPLQWPFIAKSDGSD